jgi:hypothetical protein
MGTGILATNGPVVAEHVRRFRDVLDGWLAELETAPPGVAGLRDRLASARARLVADEESGDA